MGDHATETTRSVSTTSSKPAPAGTAFFTPDEARGAGLPAGNVNVRPYPFVDDDQEPEPQLAPETKLQDSKDVVTWAFMWMSQDVEARLDALEADLRATDKPSFAEQLLRAAFRTALSAATAGASEFLAGLVVGASDALRETIKSAIENATGEALSMGAGALQGSREPLTAFIAAQKDASRHLYQKAQANWLRKGRHGVTAQAQVDALAEAFTKTNVRAAAQFHYDAGRDAWIAYLAQAHFGVRHSQVLDEDFNPVGVDPSTNLASESQRQKEGAPKTDEPELARALLGAADGVLIANAELPAIMIFDSSGLHGMAGKPVISEAYLNGVNSIIRGQYQGRSLA
ncbi:MAG: hypothetical protein ACKV2T_40740 [Kofleriaceae bacterium]